MNLNLENLKVGDEVVVIYVDKNRNRDGRKYGFVPVTEGHTIPKDGKGYFAMHSREKPHFFYSANPVHIKAAKKEQSRITAKLEKKEKLLAEKRELFSSLTETYHDNEECYSFEYLSTESLERLTIPQLKKLKGWLA